MDLVFAADSPWVWDAEKNFKRLKEENPDLVIAASRGNSVVDAEHGISRVTETHEDVNEEPKISKE